MFEPSILEFGLDVECETLVVNRLKLDKKSCLIAGYIKVFEGSKDVEDKITVLTFHMKRKKPAVHQLEFSYHRSAFVISSDILGIRSELKIIEMGIKLGFEIGVGSRRGIERIEEFSFAIMQSHGKLLMHQSLCNIIQKSDKLFFALIKRVIYFDETGF